MNLNEKTAIENEINDLSNKIENQLNDLTQQNKNSDSVENIKEFQFVVSQIYQIFKSADFDLMPTTRIDGYLGLLKRITENLSDVLNQSDTIKKNDNLYDLKNSLLELLPYFRKSQKPIDLQNDQEGMLEQARRQLEEIGKFRGETEKLVTDLQLLDKEARDFVHGLSAKGLAQEFADKAKDEKNSAENWTTTTIAAAGVTLFFLVLIFLFQISQIFYPGVESPKDNLNFQFLTTKILLSATFGLFAKWASKRASRHLAEEAKYHRLAVNMKTFDLFVQNLPEDKRNDLKGVFALKTFTEFSLNDMPTDFESLSFADLIKQFTQPKT